MSPATRDYEERIEYQRMLKREFEREPEMYRQANEEYEQLVAAGVSKEEAIQVACGREKMEGTH